MHRVELKVNSFSFAIALVIFVPNAPCGVESSAGGWDITS